MPDPVFTVDTAVESLQALRYAIDVVLAHIRYLFEAENTQFVERLLYGGSDPFDLLEIVFGSVERFLRRFDSLPGRVDGIVGRVPAIRQRVRVVHRFDPRLGVILVLLLLKLADSFLRRGKFGLDLRGFFVSDAITFD